MEIVLLVIGIVAGVVIGILIGRSKASALAAKLDMTSADNQRIKDESTAALSAAKEECAAQLEKQSAEHKKQLDELRRDSEQDLVRLRTELTTQFERQHTEQKNFHERRFAEQQQAHQSAMQQQETRHKEVTESMQKRFDETMAKVTAQVKNATEDMLKQRQKEFSEASAANIGQIVNPLRETITKMRTAMDENTLKQTAMGSEMKANIEHMIRQSEAARKSADELARVFKHGSKVQGDWGETVLDELLTSQGLTRGIHYDTQAVIRDASGATVRTDDGRLMRPDVIMHLDSRREVIIDSKVSLTAYMDYVNAETEEQRQIYLKAHVDSISKHVKELSAKDYSSYIQAPKVRMDYVIMFVPHSGAMWTALNAQPDLWRKAMEQNVFIADEQTMFAALRVVNITWTQIAQAQNHERVYELANEMLNRVGQFWKEYEQMGQQLRKASEAYDKARKKITEGGQSINTTARRLIALGAKQNDRNPLPQMIDVDDIPALEMPETTEEN